MLDDLHATCKEIHITDSKVVIDFLQNDLLFEACFQAVFPE